MNPEVVDFYVLNRFRFPIKLIQNLIHKTFNGFMKIAWDMQVSAENLVSKKLKISKNTMSILMKYYVPYLGLHLLCSLFYFVHELWYQRETEWYRKLKVLLYCQGILDYFGF